MAFTTIDKPDLYFNTKLYTGTGSTTSITGVGFQPDWVWIKSRSDADNHRIFDSVRGATKVLNSNLTNAEATTSSSLTSFDSDGFSLGGHSQSNGTGKTFASWNWLASNTTASNTDGSITSTVSANTTAGFSIVSYTGTGSAETIGHGLGVSADFIITKKRNNSNSWFVWNKTFSATQYLSLDTTNAVASASSVFGTLPTSTVYSTGGGNGTGASGDTYISYCFAEKKGFSKFGSYTGNGSTDGTFVYTGFKPAFVLQKSTAVQGWQLQDNKRLGYNGANKLLQPHDSASESDVNRIDILSNGFKVITTDAGQNTSGQKYIYMCFAENPFTTSTGIPTTAR